MIFLVYLILAITVIVLSVIVSKYVDLIEKNSSLSGAFIGGIILSAVTSLPELFTSISSTVLIKKPGLCFGNILGSDLFNLTIIAFMILLFSSKYKVAKISESHLVTVILLIFIYGILAMNMLGITDFNILTVNITSIIIFIMYIIGVKAMAKENGDCNGVEEEIDEEVATTTKLTLKQIVARFIIASILLVIASIMITYVTDMISVKLNLGAGLAGALFLGIATSLPELTSSISLARMENFNMVTGNIVGSNLFNFLILFIADVLYLGDGIYNFADRQNISLVLFGAIATIFMGILLALNNKKKKNMIVSIILSIGIITSYVLFLVF